MTVHYLGQPVVTSQGSEADILFWLAQKFLHFEHATTVSDDRALTIYIFYFPHSYH